MKPKKPSIYATAKRAKNGLKRNMKTCSELEEYIAVSQRFDRYAAQNFMRLLRALKKTTDLHEFPPHPEVLSRHRAGMRKLIKKMEEME